jgi:hypothetical protein
MSTAHTLVFVQGGHTRLRLCCPGEPDQEIEARIRSAHAGDARLLYHVEFLGIQEPGAFRRLVHALQGEAPAQET